MKKINLNTERYNSLFAEAEVYRKSAKIQAVQITAEGLAEGIYANKDIRFDRSIERYVIDTYVMNEVPRSDGGVGCVRVAALEDTRPVEVGEWIATNPKAWESDRENNYAIPDETFKKRYEPTTEQGIYRAKGMARIIKNDTGDSVEIEAPWGGSQYGEVDCYFCAPYDPSHPEDLATGERYILSANDFMAYVPLTEEDN